MSTARGAATSRPPGRPLLDRPGQQLLAAVTADPRAAQRVAVEAPGGYGKSTLLRQLRRAYRDAGVTLIDGRPAPGSAAAAAAAQAGAGESAVMLVDDAHTLTDEQLRTLQRSLAAGRTGVVLALRPWPRPPALAELLHSLGRPLRLGALSERQIAQHLGEDPDPALVSFLHQQTGGVPRLVARLAGAVSRPGAEPPPAALTGFRSELEELTPEVRTVLLAAAAGVDVAAELGGELLGRAPEELAELVAAARATGLMLADGRLPPLARRAVVALSPAADRTAVWRRLAELRLAHGGAVLPLVRTLREAGAPSTGLARMFEAAADEALADDPALAAELLAAAAAGRGGDRPTTARRALAATLAGDLDAGLRLADPLISAESPEERAAGAAVAATALAHRGQLHRSAELSRWAGTAASVGFATVGFLGSGQPDHAGPPPAGPPTLLTSAASLLARGVRESVSGSPTAALATLVQAASLLEPAGQAVLLPDTPAALAALVAVHSGELELGASVLERAVASAMGGRLMARRHQLLQAWIRMLRGDTRAAAERRAAAAPAGARLEPRDLLFATAVDAGLARRTSDLAGLRRGWGAAHEAVMRHPVDLFTLLPLGELAVAAARLGELGRLRPHLEAAEHLLDQLGRPPLWAAMLHWNTVHAAILAEQPVLADEQVTALTGLGPRLRFGQVLATAAQAWVRVLRGAVEPDAVEAAARDLHTAGLTWDAARLAGQAAIRTPDRRAMTRLLDCARTLQGRPKGCRERDLDPGGDPAGRLSAREREVAALLVEGLTYKQIGDRLFISAKTVEHHVARMRQRLGCATRRDLVTQLRVAGEEPVR